MGLCCSNTSEKYRNFRENLDEIIDGVNNSLGHNCKYEGCQYKQSGINHYHDKYNRRAYTNTLHYPSTGQRLYNEREMDYGSLTMYVMVVYNEDGTKKSKYMKVSDRKTFLEIFFKYTEDRVCSFTVNIDNKKEYTYETRYIEQCELHLFDFQYTYCKQCYGIMLTDPYDTINNVMVDFVYDSSQTMCRESVCYLFNHEFSLDANRYLSKAKTGFRKIETLTKYSVIFKNTPQHIVNVFQKNFYYYKLTVKKTDGVLIPLGYPFYASSFEYDKPECFLKGIQ